MNLFKLGQKRKRFSIPRGIAELENELRELPKDGECFKFLSDGSFSSICFIASIADKSVINNLYVSTFRVGKKEMLALKALGDIWRIVNATILVMSAMESTDTAKYPYFEIMKEVCKEKGWSWESTRNHSKVLLFDTALGKYVIETSSNLNENPKIEQFSFERDDGLFEFYKGALFDKGKDGGGLPT